MASHLLSSDFLLFGAGAGFSADSGLAVYKDVADIPIYHKLGLTYGSLCDPAWLRRNPDIFYGFWGMCYDSYMDTAPHDGYGVVRQLLDRFSGGKKAFVYTSNVDSHFIKAGVPGNRVYEFHGTCMDWQCSRPCTERAVFRLPYSFRFHVDKSTMKVPDVAIRPPPRVDGAEDVEGDVGGGNGGKSDASRGGSLESRRLPPRPQSAPRGLPAGYTGPRVFKSEAFRGREAFSAAAQRRGGGTGGAGSGVATHNCNWTTESSPPSAIEARQKFESARPVVNPGRTQPTCPRCYAPLRPRVLMFDDDQFVELDSEERRYESFREELLSTGVRRVTLIEAGCGLRIPTLRMEMERLLRKLAKKGVDCRLFRINLGDRHLEARTRPYSDRVHHVALGGLAAMKALEAALGRLEGLEGPENPEGSGVEGTQETDGSRKARQAEIEREAETGEKRSESTANVNAGRSPTHSYE